MDNELQHLLNEYFEPTAKKLDINEMFRLVEQVLEELPALAEADKSQAPVEAAEEEALEITLPIMRISEKMWGKEGSEDREILQNLLSRIVEHGTTLKDKIERIDQFLKSPPHTEDISEILTNIVLLDTLTNIMLHFNASAAGLTFEGFLSALLSGQQIKAGTAGIQDLIDNDKNPISLKLLTEKPGDVHGSYRDLVDHFVDPASAETGAQRSKPTYVDPETGETVENPYYVGKAGTGGQMTYVVCLKSFREKEAEKALTDEKEEHIWFFQFDFTAKTFFDSLVTNAHNANLLLLPESIIDPEAAAPAEQEAFDPISPEQLKTLYSGAIPAGLLSDEAPKTTAGTRAAYTKIINVYGADYAREVLDGAKLIPVPGNPKKNVLVGPDDQPIAFKTLPPGDPRIKKVGARAYTQTIKDKKAGTETQVQWLDYKTSTKLLQDALAEDEGKFWALIAQTSGYTGAVRTKEGSATQFVISSKYYRPKKWEEDGFGFIGVLDVGKAAVTNLAQKYANILNQQIFDMFKKVQILSQQINGYFIGGDKGKALEAATTAGELKSGAEEYHKQDTEQQQAMAAKE